MRKGVARRRAGGAPASAGGAEKRSPDLVNRFQREAKAASAIDTEHIARVLDAGTDSKTNAPYLVMEYLDGEDLQHLIDREGPLPPRVALKIVAQAGCDLVIAQGVEAGGHVRGTVGLLTLLGEVLEVAGSPGARWPSFFAMKLCCS